MATKKKVNKSQKKSKKSVVKSKTSKGSKKSKSSKKVVKKASKVKSKVKKKALVKKTVSKKKVTKKSNSKKTLAKKAIKNVKKSSLKTKDVKTLNKVNLKSTVKKTIPSRNSTKSYKVEFSPLDDRILIEQSGVSNMTAGGIYIPDSVVAERPNKGMVIAVGPGHRDKKGKMRPLDVKIGDEVLLQQYSGSEILIEGKSYLIIRESDVLGISNT